MNAIKGLNEYQKLASSTDTFGRDNEGLLLRCLGLAGESGEVVDKVKKVFRDHDAIFTDEDREHILKEMGDVLWYLSTLADNLGYKLSDVAEANIEKIFNRRRNNTIHGSGDDR